MITPHVKPGVTTGQLDVLCHDFMTAHGAIPATLNYRGYPKSICTSINHVVCHGIPGERRLLEGDILNIDVTAVLDGWHGDTSRMYVAGQAGTRARVLLDVTYDALMRGIAAIRPGATLGDVGHAIQSYVEQQRFSVVRDFCGHGIGRQFHEAPNVLHFGRPGDGAGAAARHVLHRRADGERRPSGGEGARRRLDRRHAGPQPVRAVRAHGRRDGGRVRGVHPLAGRAAPSRPMAERRLAQHTHRCGSATTTRSATSTTRSTRRCSRPGRTELLDAAGLFVRGGRMAPVIVRLEIDFRREMSWPGEVAVESAVARFGGKSIHIRQRTLSGEIADGRGAVGAGADRPRDPARRAAGRCHARALRALDVAGG